MKQLTVKEAREARDWTLTELAERAGLDKAHVHKLEAGTIADPSNSTAAALERALGLRRGTLVFGVQEVRA